MRKLYHFGQPSANAMRHLPLPSVVCLAPRYLISSAAEPHVLTNNLTTSGENPNNKHDLCCECFIDAARSLVHFSTSHPAFVHLLDAAPGPHLNHILFTSTESPKSTQSQSRRSTPGLSPSSLHEYLLQPLTISNCSLMLHAIYTHLVCLVAQPLPILLLC